MKEKVIRILLVVIVFSVLTGCAVNNNNSSDETIIEDHEKSSEDKNIDHVEVIVEIFTLRERFYSHEFNYKVLIDELSIYMDEPRTFVKPEATYGWTDLFKKDGFVTNKDTENLGEKEFADLNSKIKLYTRPGYIWMHFGGENNGEKVFDAIKFNESKYYITSALPRDDGSTIIYVKEILLFDDADFIPGVITLEGLIGDSSVFDYWFLFKENSSVIYSHKRTSTTAYFDEIDLHKVIMFDEEIDVQTYDVTDRVLNYDNKNIN